MEDSMICVLKYSLGLYIYMYIDSVVLLTESDKS